VVAIAVRPLPGRLSRRWSAGLNAFTFEASAFFLARISGLKKLLQWPILLLNSEHIYSMLAFHAYRCATAVGSLTSMNELLSTGDW
jgi:hypothetical protein